MPPLMFTQVFKLTSKGGQFSVEREASNIPTGDLDPSLIFEQDPSQVCSRSPFQNCTVLHR